MGMIKIKFFKHNIFRKAKVYLLPTILSIILFLLSIFAYEFFILDKFYPQTFVGDTNISFLTQGRAIKKIQEIFLKRSGQKLIFVFPQGSFDIDLATSSASIDYSAISLNFVDSKSGNFWEQFKKQFQFLFLKNQLTPKIILNIDNQMDKIQSNIEKSPINAELIFDEITTPDPDSIGAEGTISARIQIKEGIDGLILDKGELASEAIRYILIGKYKKELPIKSTPPKVTTQQLIRAKYALEQISKESIKLQFENFIYTLDTKQLLTLLDLTNGSNELLDKEKVKTYIGKVALEINQEVQEGLFEFNPTTKRVSAFKPSLDGRKLDIDKAYQLLSAAISTETTKIINLPVEVVKPKIQTSDVNSLGIKELLGSGVSNFAGSIPNRIYNVSLTASKINGVLVPPGEIFSFNKTVGDISAATGFKQAYVIKEGRTVLDDGGGVCQDSTTLFRAVLNAGLPVVKRTAHAYRVGYYEQGFPPGLDATVYYPSVDFQFKNDTSAHILIQAYTAGTTLYIDLYGTPDGRISTLTNSIISNQTPPPAELRQDDPTLPKGVVKQVDWSAWGAKVTFKRIVTRNGETIASENWVSNYKAWQAVYLVGTQ